MRDRRRERRRAAGADPKHHLVFVDRVVVTLVKLRHDLPGAGLAELFGTELAIVGPTAG